MPLIQPLVCHWVRPLHFWVYCIVSVALFLGIASPGYAVSPTQSTGQVRAELLAYAPEGLAPERPMWLGILLKHQSAWHTYWKNPGDSGLPTQLQWTLPQGVSVGDIVWPVPKKLPVANLVNYGYDDQVLLVVPLHIAPEYTPNVLSNTVPIRVRADWLVCRLECIPQSVELGLDVPLNSAIALHASLFRAVLDHLPPTLDVIATAKIQEDKLLLQSDALPAPWHGQTLEVFPEESLLFSAAAPVHQQWDNKEWRAELSLSPLRQNAPKHMAFLLQAENQQSVVLQAQLVGQWPTGSIGSGIAPALQKALDTQSQTTMDTAIKNTATPSVLYWALLGAFAGGFLLNLMPCVFPVLAIKVLGFMQTSVSIRQRRMHGLLYGLGVVLSCLVLGGLLVGLRSAGQALGWGFQLQSPWMLGFLVLLFVLLGLSLLGVFELNLYLPDRIVNARASSPQWDHFFSGILAVLVATPCTAPFMGAALGAVIVLAWAQALLVFAALGLGLALPYVVLAFVPTLGRFLPKPGAWMQTFRRILAIPMLLTALWLAWVGWQQVDVDTPATKSIATSPGSIPYGVWTDWSFALQKQLQANNQTVFTDYTAAWCITCQINERTALNRSDVMAAFAQKQVVLLKADWTNYNPEITASLQTLGRLGIPVYTLQQGSGPVQIFTELLSKDELLTALQALPNP